MSLFKSYDPSTVEARLQAFWQEQGVYRFSLDSNRPVFSIDTPPPTVSGNLHLGHVYSYSHTDFIARFWRMNGHNVYYPMGFDDNGLPTERLVEKTQGAKATQVGRGKFIAHCLQASKEAEQDYRQLWQRLGLSIDWRYTYSTIDASARAISQRSFIDLFRKGLVYRQEAPAIWCPECNTAIAQADLNDLERESELITLAFHLDQDDVLPIATTRPELLPACVAVFVHPGDHRYAAFVGRQARVPLFDRLVPILEDAAADPQKGTGVVMCCTFGDTTDVAWWRTHQLDLISAIGRDGHMTTAAGEFAGLPVPEARRQIKTVLREKGLFLGSQPTTQSVRVHERCDTPVEYIVAHQWFIRILDFKPQLLEAGERVAWYPEHMKARYMAWVENLNWDWCLSRQRYYGVPFPLWYCQSCGAVMLAQENHLPVNPLEDMPATPCLACGSNSFLPEEDVMDTWATSSMTPQIAGRWLEDPGLYAKVFPFSLRPQAHEIIRTWAFYTICKSLYHFDALPWDNVVISGWGLAGEGMGKISKSRGGGPMAPLAMIERYSADAVRYWAASTGLGKDSLISEEKIQIGARLVTKIWNVARFVERFLQEYKPVASWDGLSLSPADRWILSRTQKIIRRASALFQEFDYATAKSEIEAFFWTELTDNYLEMCKQRLYAQQGPGYEAARFTIHHILRALVKLFAPYLPYVTEEIYQGVASLQDDVNRPSLSVHQSYWPKADTDLEDAQAEALGIILVEIATRVRRYKSERNLPLGMALSRVKLAVVDPDLVVTLQLAEDDLKSITRADQVLVFLGTAKPGQSGRGLAELEIEA
ncbi:MAG: valine--tRNA ligase [Anaerolineales bacterium]|nr:valine--tRNA ligase [Anaerolineales bacterium]